MFDEGDMRILQEINTSKTKLLCLAQMDPNEIGRDTIDAIKKLRSYSPFIAEPFLQQVEDLMGLAHSQGKVDKLLSLAISAIMMVDALEPAE